MKLVLLTSAVLLFGCKAYLEGRFGAKGQPDTYKGEVPLRVVNIDSDQTRGRMQLCAFALFPAGQQKIPGDDQWNWTGWLDKHIEADDHADFKVKPGRYEVYARMCQQMPGDVHAEAISTVEIDISGATELGVNGGFDRASRIEATAGYTPRLINARPWTVGHGAATPIEPCIESGGISPEANRCCNLETHENQPNRWTCI